MSSFSNDELEAPKWMDNAFILNILKNCETDEPLEITDLKFTPGSEKGDHFASILFRATVKFITAKGSSSRSMIIKTLPELDCFKGEMLAQTKVFETEIGIYSNIVPRFEAELKKYGDNTQFTAKTLYYSLSPRKIIVFEDLCTAGYEVPRRRFLNMAEIKEMLLLLAKWHAVSFKLAAEGDESVKGFDCGFCNHSMVEDSVFLKSGIMLLADLVSTLEGYEMYADKLRALAPSLLKNCVKTFNAYKNGDKQSILVLNHGDFHMKNAMFKYNEENLGNVLLIDFQLSTFAPSVIDVIYSIYTMMSPELRQNHREELIYYYFENFVETLKMIEFTGTIPTLTDLNMDMIRHRDFEILIFSTFMPMWFNLIEPLESFEAEKIIQSVDHRAKLYHHPKFVQEIKEMLPKLLYKGYLDKDL